MLASQYPTKDHTKLRRVRSADRRRGLDRGLPRWSPGRGCTFSISDPPDRGCTISSGARFDHARSLRGLYGCPSRHFCIKASSSASLPSGSMIRVVTNRSPVVPGAFGSPLPFRRKVRPLEVFLGIDNSTALPSVVTRTLPPSTASYSV